MANTTRVQTPVTEDQLETLDTLAAAMGGVSRSAAARYAVTVGLAAIEQGYGMALITGSPLPPAQAQS